MGSELKNSILFYGGVVLVIILIITAISGIMTGNKTEVDITVNDKWIKAIDSGSDYMISDTNGNVYVIQDSLYLLSFDASDRYASIEIGRMYGITTIGWRIPVLSKYPNIIEINYGIVQIEEEMEI